MHKSVALVQLLKEAGYTPTEDTVMQDIESLRRRVLRGECPLGCHRINGGECLEDVLHCAMEDAYELLDIALPENEEEDDSQTIQ